MDHTDYREASEITVFGGASDDFISGRGGASQSPSTVRVHLSGDAGRDTVVDGPFVFDDVFGGSEDDTLFTQDGQLDSVRGDAGFDKATVDSMDTVDTVEQKIVGGVGRLQLARRTMRTGADGSARLDSPGRVMLAPSSVTTQSSSTRAKRNPHQGAERFVT